MYTSRIPELGRLWKNHAFEASLGYLAKPVSKTRELQAEETVPRSKAMAAFSENPN